MASSDNAARAGDDVADLGLRAKIVVSMIVELDDWEGTEERLRYWSCPDPDAHVHDLAARVSKKMPTTAGGTAITSGWWWVVWVPFGASPYAKGRADTPALAQEAADKILWKILHEAMS